MNILPKKRWHVRTKQNIERVRRDEAAAAEAEKEVQRRIQLAEQEARTAYLREKAKSSRTIEFTKESKQDHINFFTDIEAFGQYVGGNNKDHEKEKKEEKEKYEKNIGLLTYLGQNSVEATGNTPWYLESHSKRLKLEDEKSCEKEEERDKSKSLLDPLNIMKKYLKKEEDSAHKSSKNNRSKSSATAHKLKKEEPRKGSKISLENLRAERLKREKEERERTKQLFEKLSGKESSKQQNEFVGDERLRRYNSQFNPQLARQSYPGHH